METTIYLSLFKTYGIPLLGVVLMFFLKDVNVERKKRLNRLIVLVLITIALPLILAGMVDMIYHWLFLISAPIGGLVLLVLFVIKVWYHLQWKKSVHSP